ncbi:MAG: sensor histidine kinase [Thermodesulfovibrionales bacterium]
MIEPIRKRLIAIFTSVIVAFSALIMAFSIIILHQSLMASVKRHLIEDIRDEFLDRYRYAGPSFIKEVVDENYFQILNKAGGVAASTRNSAAFYPELNSDLLTTAFAGKQAFETRMVGKERYLISYFPLDGTYAGRAAVSLHDETGLERDFLRMILIMSPFGLLLSYLASRYLLGHAMRPISDLCTFQETFLSNINHELRSPLIAIKGNFEVTLRKERSAEEYREVIGSGLTETDRIINLLRNFALLSSSKFKPLDLSRSRTDINKIIKEIISSYAVTADTKQISLDISEIPSINCVCDEGLIRRTIENLLDNAVKYTPAGGSIRLSLSRKKGKILITVSNTCEPIEKKELENLFEPFYRGQRSHLYAEGKGLGLYIVRYIVRSHGGEVLLNETDEKLFSVTVALPAK